MSRKMFAASAAILLASPAGAQQVPGRDLLDFPIGRVAEAPALAAQSGDGFWNPALAQVPPGSIARVSVGALDSPADQGVSAQLLCVLVALPDAATAGLSVVHAGVADLLRTETDPQTVGGEIPYGTTVYSATLARRTAHTMVGFALRYRQGVLDADHVGAIGLDAGIAGEELLGLPLRVGASTFLWRPANARDELTTYNIAADYRVFGTDSLHAIRGGYSLSVSERESQEHYLYGIARYGAWELRGGVADYVAFGNASLRSRLGMGLRYARYLVGVAREDNGAGLSATYQFSLSALIK